MVKIKKLSDLAKLKLNKFLNSLSREPKLAQARAELDTQVQLLLTQKGVGYLTALCLINTIGDIRRFTKPTRQVPAFIGIEPLGNESAGKIKATRISRAGSSLARFLLGQSANIVARYDTQFKSFNQRLSKRKPKPVAKTATARKILVKLVIMLRDQITAEEFDRRGRNVNNARRVQGLQ